MNKQWKRVMFSGFPVISFRIDTANNEYKLKLIKQFESCVRSIWISGASRDRKKWHW